MLFSFIERLILIITGHSGNTDEVMHLQCNLFSRKGLEKEINEDAFLVDRYDNYLENNSTFLLTSDSMHVFAVFDGVSAGGNGEKSSEMAVKHMQSVLNYNMKGFDDTFFTAVDTVINNTNSNIYNAFSRQSESKWGTTLAMIIIYRSQCVVYNVGDSRIYRLTNSSLIQLSHDHTLESYKRQLGFLKKDPYISEKDGSILYRCLGKEESIDYNKYGPFKIESKDKLLICSDGISGFLDRKSLSDLLQSNQDQIVRNLADAAREAGSVDDQTGIIISVE